MKDFQTFLEDALRRGKEGGCFPSAAAAIGVKDQVLAQAFVGEAPLPGGNPVNEHTRYDMASLSKVLGPTMIALKAIEDGSLKLSDRVADFFPDVPDDKRSITILNLMTHTGGFHPSFRLDHLPEPDPVKAILAEPLWEKPGVRPIYSCMGYILLAKILEKKFSQPLNVLAKERVFTPLGMTETGYCPEDPSVCAATEVDPETGKPWIGIVHDENARHLKGISGNAGVFMPLKDGIRFASMLSRMGEGFFKRSTMEMAIKNYTPGQDEHRGLGFHLAGTPDCFFSNRVPDNCFGHTGFTGTSMLVQPDTGFWVLLLSNRVYPTRNTTALFPFRRALHGDSWEMFSKEAPV